VPSRSIIESRGDQMFPVLQPAELERLRRFGTLRSYASGQALARVGDAGHGLTIILAGKVDITQHNSGRRVPIVTHEEGAFMGELAQLSGRPSLVDAHAQGTVEALIIPPERLRALLVAEAELGERIMRTLILRRVGLIERGAGGPLIVGPAEHGDVVRLDGFLSRNGHPHQNLDPTTDPEARALLERFEVDPEHLPNRPLPRRPVAAQPYRDRARPMHLPGGPY
jgi:thioredoxin reductase (NADPH)